MRPFEVTTPKTTVQVGTDGKSVVTFSVSNVSGQPLRANFVVLPDDPKTASWIAVGGTPSFDFGKDTTLAQVPVNITAPANGTPGRYTFKLRALSAERPDDDFTDSDTIAFTVVTGKGPGFPWWIVIAAAVVVAIGIAAVVFATSHKSVPVPNLANMTKQQAQDALTHVGLKMALASPVPGSPAGNVASFTPGFNTPAPAGSNVTVTLYGQSVAVPSTLKNQTVAQAVNTLNGVGLGVGRVCGTNGLVVSTNPEMSTTVLTGSAIELHLSDQTFAQCLSWVNWPGYTTLNTEAVKRNARTLVQPSPTP